MGKKKEKITYVDDGRTLADMSGVGGFRGYEKRPAYYPRPGIKEQMKTFFGAMRMMVLPMLVAVGAILLIYVILYILFSVM